MGKIRAGAFFCGRTSAKKTCESSRSARAKQFGCTGKKIGELLHFRFELWWNAPLLRIMAVGIQPFRLKTNLLYRGEACFQAERLVSPTERSSDLREKGAPPLNGLRSNAALAIPRKSVWSVQPVLPCWASTERKPETCFSPQQLLCLHTEWL
jgi:hypothetical protein